MAKTLLTLEHIKLSFGLRTVLDIDHFSLAAGEKLGLVGENGAGKTTLLRIIAGELLPEEGVVELNAPATFIHQMDGEGETTVTDKHLISLFGVRPESGGLSGGERTRRRIASALDAGAEVLLADEPTADLDQAGVEQLERALIAHTGALILISHDRALLENVSTGILELEDGKLTRFPGGYAAYRAERENRRAFKQQEYEQFRSEQQRLRAAIQNRRESVSQVLKTPKRMGNSEARLHKRSSTEVEQKISQSTNALKSRLNMLEEKERPRDDPNIRMRLGVADDLISKVALTVRDLTLRVPGRVLLENASMALPTGSRTALLGPNGSGKTTLIRRIMAADDPRIRLAPGARIGWFGQDHQATLNLGKTVLENVLEDAIHPQDVVRTVLARLGLRGDQVFKPVAVLSGGERAKTALARILVGRANVLLLDEPTNHLDLYAMDTLESVLGGYAGTMLLVSHDRALVRSVATRLVTFEGTSLVTFEGTIDERDAQAKGKALSDAGHIEGMLLDMKLAELAGRIARPRKGDKVVELRDEYERLAAQKRRPIS